MPRGTGSCTHAHSHNYIGHNYTGAAGRNYIGHNYIGAASLTNASRDEYLHTRMYAFTRPQAFYAHTRARPRAHTHARKPSRTHAQTRALAPHDGHGVERPPAERVHARRVQGRSAATLDSMRASKPVNPPVSRVRAPMHPPAHPRARGARPSSYLPIACRCA